jgi:hypothetical protein
MKYLKYLIESLVGLTILTIALVALYFMSWFLNEHVGNLVGWMALGIAASAAAGQK